MKLRLLYHGQCFDGVASAAVFTRFYRERIANHADVDYTPLLHRPGSLFDEEMFDGDENAIVDFKYSPSDKLTWWFDHHQSAFLSKEDEAHFRADQSGRKFWDADSKSCTEYIARIALEKFGYEDATLRPLIEWAHIIDGAFYESPEQVVELAAPALQLMQVIENVDDRFSEKLIRRLAERPLDEVATGAEVQERLRPILALHHKTLEVIRRKITCSRGVATFDLIDEGYEGFNKFIPYYLHPETIYSVALIRTPQRTKISVGSNPWNAHLRTHNIADICERYDGGGHAVVGAVSYRPDEVELARQTAREIIAKLSLDVGE